MNAKRKAAEETILKYIDKIAPGGKNKEIYENLFKNMSDSDFDRFMVGLRDKTITLAVICPIGNEVKLTTENSMKVAEELGYKFEQHITISGSKELPDVTTPIKYVVMLLPFRRAAQLLTKKISIPENDRYIDPRTGQVTNVSQSSKLTLPEIQLLNGMGINKATRELLKIRGGDIGAQNALKTLLFTQGSASQAQIEQYATGVESTKTLNAFFNAMHIKTTL
jgi:hypothetical protein